MPPTPRKQKHIDFSSLRYHMAKFHLYVRRKAMPGIIVPMLSNEARGEVRKYIIFFAEVERYNAFWLRTPQIKILKAKTSCHRPQKIKKMKKYYQKPFCYKPNR